MSVLLAMISALHVILRCLIHITFLCHDYLRLGG